MAIVKAYELWVPPSSPNAYNDEFDSHSLGADWTVWGDAFSGTVIDPYAVVAGSAPRVDFATIRPSWMLIQSPADATSHGIYKPITLGTNMAVWSRMAQNCVVNANTSIWLTSLQLMALSDGNPDLNNRVGIDIWSQVGGNVQARFYRIGDGSTTYSTADMKNTPSAWEYVLLQKRDATYHGWIATADGSWTWLGSLSEPLSAPTVVSLAQYNNADISSPGSMVSGWDFVRFVSGDYLP